MEEVGRSDIGKKIKEGMEEAAKTAKQSAETVSKGGGKLGKTGAFRAISQVPIMILSFHHRNAVYGISCELSCGFLHVCCESGI